MSSRLFVALPSPPAVREALARAQEGLAEALSESDVRWQDLTRSHLTLSFLGEVPLHRLELCHAGVVAAARRTPPLQLRTGGLGAFPGLRRPSVLWLGVEGDLDGLNALHRRLEGRLRALAPAAPPEGFRPHLTLARVRKLAPAERGPLQARLAAPPPVSTAWEVRTVQLLESRLGRHGATHSLLLEAPLAS